MGRILVDRARARGRQKRGGDRGRLELDGRDLFVDQPPEELLDLDEALDRLAALDATEAEVVKLRFFAGLTRRETAAAHWISLATVERHWVFVRSWLYDATGGAP